MTQKLLMHKLIHKNFCGFIFATSFLASKFSALQLFVTNICIFIFDSKETTHAEINVQKFVTQKTLLQNFLSQKKTRAKINSQKYLPI